MEGIASLVWLRRDLRDYDHIPMALACAERGKVQMLFVFDTDILARFDNPHDRRLSFIARALHGLHRQLTARGGGVAILHGRAVELIPRAAAALQAQRVYCGRDYEAAGTQRDMLVAESLRRDGRELMSACDHLLIPADELLKENGEAYRVFTPFAKRWRAALREERTRDYSFADTGRYPDYDAVIATLQKAGLPAIDAGNTPAAILSAIGYCVSDEGEWDVAGARNRLHTFAREKLAAYQTQRDLPALSATSKLSPYLRFGLVSIREAWRETQALAGAGPWINELAWREFYAMIMHRFPESEHTEFLEHYRNTIPWNADIPAFERWCRGATGFPLVDAAMRELLQTGWMHNRARMVVAAFLTKDLLIDWRLGEAHFARHLMDYELASNVGGWQWAASTGTDAAPYFRIFNPYRQSERFDPKGEYIRRFVPELAALSAPHIHRPPEDFLQHSDYPPAIVDHQAARARALEAFRRNA